MSTSAHFLETNLIRMNQLSALLQGSRHENTRTTHARNKLSKQPMNSGIIIKRWAREYPCLSRETQKYFAVRDSAHFVRNNWRDININF